MPRIAAKDTAPRRKLKMIESITRWLDTLPEESLGRVLTWMDGLVEGDTADSELKAMRAIATQFEGAEVEVRDSVVRWINAEYGHDTPEEAGSREVADQDFDHNDE